MKWAFWIWTATCGVVVVVAFFGSPGWDTDAGYFLSGAEVFVAIALLMCGTWLVGLGILATIGALVGAIRRRAR